MTYALILLGAIIAAINTLFILYVFSMNVQRVYEQQRMTGWHWFFAGGWVVVAIVLDVILNFTILALLTLDFPKRKELTFSQRLERLVKDTGWRGKAARATAFILNPFDPKGYHINDPRTRHAK
jgi:MFS family permease